MAVKTDADLILEVIESRLDELEQQYNEAKREATFANLEHEEQDAYATALLYRISEGCILRDRIKDIL